MQFKGGNNTDKQLKNVLKVILIVGIILYAVSILLPWGHYTIDSNSKLDLYSWGAHSINYNFFNQSGFVNDNWIIYLAIPDFTSMLGNSDNVAVKASWGIAFLILPFFIAGLIVGIISINYHEKMLYLASITAIFMIMTIISFYIFNQFGISSLIIHKNLGNIPFSIGVGLIFALVGLILLFIMYFTHYFINIQKN